MCMKKKNRSFDIRDGSQDTALYGVDDYMHFVSNGMADNEKIEAADYFEQFLSEDAAHE